MSTLKTPEDWRQSVANICKDMGVSNFDTEALNALTLVLQQETVKILKSCTAIAKSEGRSTITMTNARVACHLYDTSSIVNPRFHKKKLCDLAEIINSQPLLPECFMDPELCTSLNLSAPPWKLSNYNKSE
ncbi:uncharacterized protein LOC128884366 [Hylaeus volcanicus]|uniref:uncharacterized protein LOC128884366 n=1 Tax=Hylaeus volcanicus TaxID=313075 RepID=UPI0023B81CF8|nr:uncharacterized protein LOC128884366 [Hylaeus volcanicus]